MIFNKMTWPTPSHSCWLAPILLIALAVSGCTHRPPAVVDPDQQVIDVLTRNHSDLQKPHRFDFYLFVPTKVAAASAAVRLSEEGYKSVVRRGADGKNWLCLASKTFVPDKPRIHEAQARMKALAVQYRGEYDGWESDLKR
jgi:hypothetical protein